MVHPVALFAAIFAASTAATVTVAWLTYRCIEMPAIDLGHFLARQIQLRFQKTTS
jgi:peptidoglycan/LPS O-acetylase OafA/YrhL